MALAEEVQHAVFACLLLGRLWSPTDIRKHKLVLEKNPIFGLVKMFVHAGMGTKKKIIKSNQNQIQIKSHREKPSVKSNHTKSNQ